MGPQYVAEEQKQKRVHWCHFILCKFDGKESNAVWDIITGDGAWVYCFNPETKQRSHLWIPVGQRPPQKYLYSYHCQANDCLVCPFCWSYSSNTTCYPEHND